MNLKLHLLVSAVFLVLIFGALVYFSALTPQSQEPLPVTKDRFIQIKSATWGENCNDFIQTQRDRLKNSPADTPVPEPVRKNNALRVVSSLCNGKETCQFTLAEESLGFDPAPQCDKNMELEYRCFLTDIAHSQPASYGESVYIDCTDTAE